MVASRVYVAVGVAFSCAALSKEARAQLTGDQAVAVAGAAGSKLPPDSFGGELLFGAIGDDLFLTLALRLNFDRENWGVGLQLPVRIRVHDEPPENDSDIFGVIRNEDWDQPSDFFRLLRYVYIGQADKKGPFYIRGGELSRLTVGHGTIMHRYFNAIDASRWRAGLNVAVNVGAFGGEGVIGDVTDPYLAGLRFTVRPLMLAMGEGWIQEKLVFGASLMTDSKAPFELETQPSDPANPASPSVAAIDDDNAPIVTRERALAVAGVDVGIELVDTGILSITPYTDLNKMNVVENGWGWHLGILWGLNVPVAVDSFIVDLRTEYRRVSSDYLGPYFDTVYEIQRYQLLGAEGGTPTTKLRGLCGPSANCTGSTAGGKNGVFFDLLAGLPSFVFVGGEFIDYDGGQADGTLRLSLEVPALEIVKFSAFYYRINIDGLDDLIAIDDRSAIVAQAQVPIYWVFTLNLKWWRVWQAEEVGGYRSVDDWSVGVGFSLEL